VCIEQKKIKDVGLRVCWVNSGCMQHADRQTAEQKGLTYCRTSPNTSAQVSPKLQERRGEAPKDSIQTSQTDQTHKDRDRDFLSNRNPSRGTLTFWKNINSAWYMLDINN